MQIRFLPLMIFLCTTIIMVKLVDISQGKTTYSDILLVAEVEAADAKKEETPSDKKKDDDKKPDEQKQDLKSSTERPKEVELPKYNEHELALLQELTKRRKELDKRAEELTKRENLLAVADDNIQSKIDGLEKIKIEVNAALDKYKTKQNEKILSLVKIYETMKPRDAAKIFERLDMNVTLEVMDKMKESKSAAILGQMLPEKAKEITTNLAYYRKLPNQNNLNMCP
jgi:flagellar motility protein MotE (MotC chaperone)